MTSIRTSAAGKVVLSGEYAVLCGAPAVAMAVDRRACVALDSSRQAEVTSEGLGGRTDTRLLECVCNALDIEVPGQYVSLDTAAFVDVESQIKFGIGSSAALTVALTRALAPQDASDEALSRVAQSAHREFQNGVGSGVDIATSACGGIIVYRMQTCGAEKIGWPDGLLYALLWSGVPASTHAKIADLDVQSEQLRQSSLMTAANETAIAWTGGDAGTVLASYVEYLPALKEFDAANALQIFGSGHDELATAAADFVYKPCGAGGGDIGIALSTDSQRLERFLSEATDRGFTYLDMTIDHDGARVEEMTT